MQILRQGTNAPLQIAGVGSESSTVEFEVLLSYDLLRKYDFVERNGRLHLIINERVLTPYCDRAKNGDVILGCDLRDLSFGTNYVQAELTIYQMVGAAPAITGTGPVFDFIRNKANSNSQRQ